MRRLPGYSVHSNNSLVLHMHASSKPRKKNDERCETIEERAAEGLLRAEAVVLIATRVVLPTRQGCAMNARPCGEENELMQPSCSQRQATGNSSI
jgi:hypothetical protein